MSLAEWKGVARPRKITIAGKYCRLEPFSVARHAATLFEASAASGSEERFRYLFDAVPESAEAFADWMDGASADDDPMFFAVIDNATGRAEGRQALMRIDPAHGTIEVGSVMWGPAIARTRVATEALFLFADSVFSQNYRRFEWKCDNLNVPSKRAAERFGFQFEGIFRQHMVVKSQNRDTAWFAIIDRDWPRLRVGYQAWLAPENFDASGQQRTTLRFG